MKKSSYGTFKLGRRGRRGRFRHDMKWRIHADGMKALEEDKELFLPSFFSGNVLAGDHNTLAIGAGVWAASPVVRDERDRAHSLQDNLVDNALSVEEPDPNDPEEPMWDETEVVAADSTLEPEPELPGSQGAEGYRLPELECAGAEAPGLRALPEIRLVWYKLCRWQSVLGFLLLNGTGRVSVEQYDAVQVIINSLLKLCYGTEELLPASSTIRRSVQPFLQSYGFVASEIRTALVDSTKIGARSGRESSQQSSNTVSFIVVVPSAWSRMDISFKYTWDILKRAAKECRTGHQEPIFSTIDSVPMVTDKTKILDVAKAIVPTTLIENGVSAPLLLSARSVNPHITLHLDCMPPFPPDALVGMDTVIGGDGEGVQIRSIGVISVPVTQRHGMEETQLDKRVHRADVLNGRFLEIFIPRRSLWRAGDVCTLLQGSVYAQNILVMVHQHVRNLGEPQCMLLLCIPFQSFREEDDTCVIHFHAATRCIVSNMSISDPSCVSPELPPASNIPSFGKLKDGRLFFVDRILLYSDGFSQYNFKEGSAGGVYSLSLNYPVELRRSRERVRVLALTPPGVSTMEGLRSIIDDLVASSTTGVEVRNSDGDEMVLFTDIVGYVADYHETGHALDIMGQNGKAPCHLCAFLRYSGHPSTASRYAYSSLMHSADTCYSRMAHRTECIRASNPTEEELVNIGLSLKDVARKKNSPLHELSHKLKEAVERTDIPLTEQDNPVVNPQFDPYRSVLVSPDHVLFGVATNALNFAFASLPSTTRRKQIDTILTTWLRRNGLQTETQIFNFNTLKVHAASISTRFCTLLISPEIFKECFDDCVKCGESTLERNSPAVHSVRNLTKLRDLVALTYWFPTLSVDGASSTANYNYNGGRQHLAKLERMSEDYVNNVNETCKLIPKSRAELDKPNVHRMLELYKHSIPAMGHVRHFSELIFETAHQPLKRAMLRSNFRDSHLQSSLSCIADDWKRRLQSLMTAPFDETEADFCREKELMKLLCGRKPEMFDALSSEPTFLRQASTILRSHPLKAILNANPSRLNMTNVHWTWLLSYPTTVSVDNSELFTTLNEIRKLARDYLVLEGNAELKTFLRASRTKTFASDRRSLSSTPRKHDIIYRDTVVQAWTDDEHSPCLSLTHDDPNREARLNYFAVEMLLNFNVASERNRCSGCQSYAAVRKCERRDSVHAPSKGDLLQVNYPAPLQLLPLTDGVRRVALVHACANGGDLNCFSASPTCPPCNASILRGHKFYYYDKRHGFPPRMA